MCCLFSIFGAVFISDFSPTCVLTCSARKQHIYSRTGLSAVVLQKATRCFIRFELHWLQKMQLSTAVAYLSPVPTPSQGHSVFHLMWLIKSRIIDVNRSEIRLHIQCCPFAESHNY
jgi:hypothetical protein